ncbi:MAG: hypothetical protein AAGH42_09385 [Pseudomonadota bacterium]
MRTVPFNSRKPGRIVLLAAVCTVMINACGGSTDNKTTPAPQDPTTAQAPTPGATLVKSVATTDEPIVLPSPATGLAFWEHPTLPFEGMVIAATQNGLYAHQPEGTEAQTVIADFRAHGAALAYLPGGFFADTSPPDGPVSAARGLFVSYDLDQSAYRFFGIDNISGTLAEDFLSLPVQTQRARPIDFCLTASGDAQEGVQFSLVALERGAVSVYRFGRPKNAGAQTSGWSISSQTYPTTLEALSCATDPGTDRLLILDVDGTIHTLNPASGTTEALFNTGVQQSAGLGIHQRTVGEDDNSRPEKLVFVVDGTSGQVDLFTLVDGTRVGAVRLTAFDVNEGVIETSALAVSSGNFGGLYRAGVVALAAKSDLFKADDGTQPTAQGSEPQASYETDLRSRAGVNAIRLTPFVAVSNALGLASATVINERPRPQTADSDAIPGIEIDFALEPVIP